MKIKRWKELNGNKNQLKEAILLKYDETITIQDFIHYWKNLNHWLMSIRFSWGARLQRGRGIRGLHRITGNIKCNKNNAETKKNKTNKDIKQYITLNKNLN